MLRVSACVLYRTPKIRRPRERAWEVLNTRDFGLEEGAQNYRMWALTAGVALSLLFFETYKQVERIMARGDTCAACDAAREHYRLRAAGNPFETRQAEIDEIKALRKARK
jgi:hypothetical protein